MDSGSQICTKTESNENLYNAIGIAINSLLFSTFLPVIVHVKNAMNYPSLELR